MYGGWTWGWVVMDATPKGGERNKLDEVGLFTVKSDKVVQEEYLYLMG